MMQTFQNRLDTAITSLPLRYPGPGGAVAVLKDGQVLVRHAWGFANVERRIPFTPRTVSRLCSMSKQFTCGLVLDALGTPDLLDAALVHRLRHFEGRPPRAVHLCHNQSGFRDYWVLAMLLGASATSPFGDVEVGRLLDGMRTLQFDPGTQFSYTSLNFRLLGDLLADRLGRRLSDLARTHLFDRYGMESAICTFDTRAMPDGTEGYEGTPDTGFRPAENNIFWTGDAGFGASLDDLIAWERAIDAERDDPSGLYNRLSQPAYFEDGSLAAYGFGLFRETRRGRSLTGHGGSLRGWRTQRLHSAADRISVVVLFNHMADARAAALELLDAVTGDTAAVYGNTTDLGWDGAWLEEETGLSASLVRRANGRYALRYLSAPETLSIDANGTARSDTVCLEPQENRLRMLRPMENRATTLRRLEGAALRTLEGSYVCDDFAPSLDGRLKIVNAGGALYGVFSGAFGSGRMEQMRHVGGNVWILPCFRALDVAPPGDWTISMNPDGFLTVGCWFARGLRYRPC